MEQQSHMNPVPYLRVLLKLEDKATHWSTYTISLSETDAAVSMNILTTEEHWEWINTVQSPLFMQLNLKLTASCDVTTYLLRQSFYSLKEYFNYSS
jgi:hypothetical protein